MISIIYGFLEELSTPSEAAFPYSTGRNTASGVYIQYP